VGRGSLAQGVGGVQKEGRCLTHHPLSSRLNFQELRKTEVQLLRIHLLSTRVNKGVSEDHSKAATLSGVNPRRERRNRVPEAYLLTAI
jgi:hypothetical protein